MDQKQANWFIGLDDYSQAQVCLLGEIPVENIPHIQRFAEAGVYQVDIGGEWKNSENLRFNRFDCYRPVPANEIDWSRVMKLGGYKKTVLFSDVLEASDDPWVRGELHGYAFARSEPFMSSFHVYRYCKFPEDFKVPELWLKDKE